MITIDQINRLQDLGISLGMLKLLLVTEEASRIDDIINQTGLARRTIGKLVNSNRELLHRFYNHETPTGLNGAPRTKMIIRTARATRLMDDVFNY